MSKVDVKCIVSVDDVTDSGDPVLNLLNLSAAGTLDIGGAFEVDYTGILPTGTTEDYLYLVFSVGSGGQVTECSIANNVMGPLYFN